MGNGGVDFLDNPVSAGSNDKPEKSVVPAGRRRSRWRDSYFSSLLMSLLCVAMLVAVAWAWVIWRTGSAGAGLAYLAGNSVYAGPENLMVSGRETSGREIALTNLTGKPVNVVGYYATCSCVKISGLPVQLGPYQTKLVPVVATSAESLDVAVVFMADAADQGRVRMTVKVVAQ